jgi:hypothetical protein
MTVSLEKIFELRVKNLEMLQTLISRMAGYGASFKSYCITVTTGVIGFGLTLRSPALALLALLPVLAFAVADAQYLRVERRFRALFDAVRKEAWDAVPAFDISLERAPPQSFISAAASWSVVWFYAPLAIVVIVAVLGVKIYG